MQDAYSPMPVEDMSDAQYEIAMELLRAINSMSNNDSMLIPNYLLRIQLLEFNLRYLWRRYGFHTQESDAYEWTLGKTINSLKGLNDNYFREMIPKLEKINNYEEW